MDDSAWSGYGLQSVDLTHDGKPEVIYREYIYFMGDGVEEWYYTIYEKTENGLQKMDKSGLFEIDMLFERLDENTLRICFLSGTCWKFICHHIYNIFCTVIIHRTVVIFIQ